MSTENMTVLDGILKDHYTDIIRDQTEPEEAIFKMFEKMTDAEWSGDGRQAIAVADLAHNEGVGGIAEDNNLPTAGNFDPQQFKIPMKYLYASFKMTAQVMKSARSGKGAFTNAMNYSMQTTTRNLRRERSRMLWGYGEGRLALVNGAVSSSTTVNVDAPGGVAGATGGARYLRKGMILAIDSGTDVAATIASVAAAGTSFVTTAAISADDNSIIYRLSTAGGIANTGEWGKSNEPMGLLGLVDDGTYIVTLHNLSRTTYPQLKSRVHAAVGALSLDAMQLNFDVAHQLGDGEISMLAGHHSTKRAYLALLEADRRYTGSDLSAPDGGTKAVKRGQYVTFGGVPFVDSKHAPYGMIFGIDKKDFSRYVQIDGEWANESGAILRQDPGKDTWTAFWRLWENYHLMRPNTCFRMDGVTTSAVYVASY